MNKRLGKTDLFGGDVEVKTREPGKKKKAKSKTSAKKKTSAPGRGRPQVHEPGSWERTTVILRHDQTAALDHLAADIRAKTGRPIKRTELIRGILDAVLESKLDLTSATSEQEIKNALAAKLRRNKKG